MLKNSIKEFSFVRITILTVALLLMPFSVFASGFEHHAGKTATHPAGDHQAHSAIDPTPDQQRNPAKSPLHCHQKSPMPQTAAWVLDPSTPDQATPTIVGTTSFKRVRSLLNRNSVKTAAAGPPLFILFGNFRS